MEITTGRNHSNLFRSSTPVSSPIITIGEAPPRILPSEVRVSIKSMQLGTAPDLILYQRTFFGPKEKNPDQWKTSRTVHVHNKGERLRNYRPICLLSVLYKVFTKIILSCLGHIQTVSRVMEVCREYLLSLVLTFVDYEKAFDSVETNAILSALVDQSVGASYVRTLANCYDRPRRYSFSTAPSKYPLEGGTIRRYCIAETVHCCIAMDNEITFLGRKGHTC
ncbi:hypothetical protein RB195_004344 [Necator americanus]|uniref:Reverse transcriptase domain-containing protein n=1 Tax=Necator americanus TaxID=51031 RepID=A0ABR1BHP9_NECAM